MANSYRNNFWYTLCKDQHKSVDDVAKYLNVAQSTVFGYFSGSLYPPEDTIKKLCEFFKLDEDPAKYAFDVIFNRWGVDHADKYCLSPHGKRYCRKKSEPEASDKDESNEKKSESEEKKSESEEELDIKEAALKLVYKRLSYEDFNKAAGCINRSCTEFLDFVYGKVDCAIFRALDALIVD